MKKVTIIWYLKIEKRNSNGSRKVRRKNK